MITAAAIVFAINVFTSIIKTWIYPKFGAIGVQVTVFALALVGAAYVSYGDAYPSARDFIISAISLFSLAVAFYEVILSHIPSFRNGIFSSNT